MGLRFYLLSNLSKVSNFVLKTNISASTKNWAYEHILKPRTSIRRLRIIDLEKLPLTSLELFKDNIWWDAAPLNAYYDGTNSF